MATAAVRGVLAAIRRSDADLLRRFAAGRDDAAFAELVRRHGPLVLGVCRRVVADRHLADDAFQAAFVVLADKAGGLDADRPLGPWLYGVAFRVALRARLMIGRRRKRETLTASVPDVPTPSRGTGGPAGECDLSAVVDEEIARLSAVCREAVVLCEMQGLSRKEAAARLGVAEGTLSSRLAAARKSLAERLRKRGVALGSGIFSTIFVPTELHAAAVAVSTGKVKLSTQIAKLVEGATHMALLSKLKLAAVAAAVVLLSAGGFGVWPGGESAAAPVPKAKDEGLIWTHTVNANTLAAYTPDGKEAKKFALPDGLRFVGFTPDGTKMVFGKKGDNGMSLHLGPIDDSGTGTDTGLGWEVNDQFVFSPDGSQVVRARLERVGQVPPGGKVVPPVYSHTLFDLAAKKETPIALPTGHQVVQWAADGKTWRVQHYNLGQDANLPNYRWLITPVGEKPDLKPICDTHSFLWLDPAPDGKGDLGVGWKHVPVGGAAGCELLRVTDGTAESVMRVEGVAFMVARRSPDGKRAACIKYQYDARNEKLDDTVLTVLDADGRNEAKLFTVPDDGQQTRLLGWFPTKPADARRRNAPPPKAAPPEGVIVVSSFGTDKPIEIVKPDGTPVKVVKWNDWSRPYLARQSPDGNRLLWMDRGPDDPAVKFGIPWRVHWLDLEAEKLKGTIAEDAYNRSVAWSADGKSVYFSRRDPNQPAPRRGDPLRFETWVYDLGTGKKKRVDVPPEHAVLEVSPDGRSLLTRTVKYETDEQVMHLTPLSTLEPERLGEAVAVVYSPRFSPDGKRILYSKITDTPAARMKLAVGVIDVGTKKETPVPLPKAVEAGGVYHLCWSPDGKRIALHWHEGSPDKGAVSASRVTVCDADGANAKVIVKRQPGEYVLGLDWR